MLHNYYEYYCTGYVNTAGSGALHEFELWLFEI
jgi:hypothetical protein